MIAGGSFGSGSSAVDGRLAVAFFSGFGVLACEILWGRIAKFLLGDRTIAVSLLLFVFICALGLGSLIAPSLGRRFAAGPGRTVGRLIAWILLQGLEFLERATDPKARKGRVAAR